MTAREFGALSFHAHQGQRYEAPVPETVPVDRWDGTKWVTVMVPNPYLRHCPNCGSTTGQPRSWDFGIDPDTGYHDAGEGCTECAPERGE